MSGPRVMTASGDIPVSVFVKISGSHTVAKCGAGEDAFGISQSGGYQAPIPSVTDSPALAAANGVSLNVFTDGMQCLLKLGAGGATYGAKLKSDTNGAGVALTAGAGTAEKYGAIALASGAEGELIPVQVVSSGTITTPA